MRLTLAIPIGGVLLLFACAEVPTLGESLHEAVLEPTLPVLRRGEEVPFHDPEVYTADEVEADADQSSGPFDDPIATPIGDDTRYPFDLRGVPVAEAIHLIAAKAGVNIYLNSGLYDPVDANFPSITLDQALGVILTQNGLSLVEDPPGIYWVERRDGTQIETAMFQLESINALDVSANLEALIGDSAEVVVDANQNLILVRGSGADVDFIGQYLEQVDKLKGQVLIEVEILEIILDDRFELGVSAALGTTDIAREVLGTANVDLSTLADEFTAVFTHTTKGISATVNGLSHFGAVNVVSSPRVLAVTNTPATIEVITEVPYIDTSTQITGGAGDVGTTSQEQVAFKEVGIKMTVTPVIQEGGVVSLVVDQEFSEVVDFFLNIPVVDTRKVATSLLVGQSQTAMIGGLIQDRQTEIDRGVPVLMHVPVLGHLFRSDEDSTERRELIVLLRPRLANPSEASELAEEYKDSYIQRVRASGLAGEREGVTSK